jgi:MshEN domain
MQRLGEILIERGVLSLTELHTALETCHRTGGRLGTQLLEFGYVEERMLLDALSKQLGVPGTIKIKLLHSPLEVRKMLPTQMGRRLQAVPFEVTKGGIKVAMTNPNDRAAMDEIAGHLNEKILPHVATETAVLAALGGAENDDADWSPGVEPSVVKARRSGDVEGWNRLWEPPRFQLTALFRPLRKRVRGGEVALASFPDLTAVTSRQAMTYELRVDESNFSDLIHQASNRDEIGGLLARYIASKYDRVCIFSVHKGTVGGWMARGRSVVLEDLQSFAASLDEPSIFADVGHSDSYVGAILDNSANSELIQALADPAPTEVVAVPVRVKQRVVAFVLCDDPGYPASQEHLDDVVTACRKAGVALEVLILRKKLLS